MKLNKIFVCLLSAIFFNINWLTTAKASTTYKYTRSNMEGMLKDTKKKKYKLPYFDSTKIKDIPNVKMEGKKLDVWDSWPVKYSNGEVAVIHGYYVVMGLVGSKELPNGLAGKIGIFYQKVNDYKKGIHSWKYGGLVFNSRTEGVNGNDDVLKHETGQWSGSATVQKNNKIRLMYTSYSGDPNFGGYGNEQQTLATAQIDLKKSNHGLSINHKETKDHKSIFAGDGKYYELVNQAYSKDIDDHCLRDPQLVINNGKKYLIFEGNTGTIDPSGLNSFNEISYYGNKDSMNKETQILDNNPILKKYTLYSNGAIGILELNDDYSIKKVMRPLVTFNLVDDEIERPSIIMYNNHWFLFTVTHGLHIDSSNAIQEASYMLGFSSKNLTGNYRPLNKNGLVIYNNQKTSSRNYTYSYAVNQMPNNPFLVTGYATQTSNFNVGHSTFMPTVKLEIYGKHTKVLDNPLKQGQLKR